MSLTLYHHPNSQPVRTVLAFLKMTGIPYQEKILDLMNDDQKNPDFLAINPLGQVPVIDDAGFHLWEADAIIKYLINTRNVGVELYPTDAKTRGIIDRYMAFHHSTVRQAFCSLGLTAYNFKKKTPKSLPPYEKLVEAFEEACKKLEEVYLKEWKYLAGDTLTLPDLFLTNEITQLLYHKQYDFSKYPKIKAYAERCLQNEILNDVQSEVKKNAEEV